MNVGGVTLALLFGGLVIGIRHVRTSPSDPDDRLLRKSLLILAITVPLVGLAIPFLPWRAAAALIVLATAAEMAAALRPQSAPARPGQLPRS